MAACFSYFLGLISNYTRDVRLETVKVTQVHKQYKLSFTSEFEHS